VRSSRLEASRWPSVYDPHALDRRDAAQRPGADGGAVRYTVREGAGGQVRIQKWRAGHGKEATYIVEPKGWWQRCSCPARAVCKHQRLVSLIDSGRLNRVIILFTSVRT
jgi:hypothetical protein